MALTPQNYDIDDIDFIDDVELVDEIIEPSRTWLIDYKRGRIGDFIDDERAIRQFIAKAISTARDHYIIYNEDYGCDIFDLFGQSLTTDLIEAEIPRYLRDALVYDDRIEDVSDISIDLSGDILHVEITVELVEGENITEGVTLYV